MRSLGEIVYGHLVPYLGPHTTRAALRTFSVKAVGKAPDALTLSDMPEVLSALRPMMRTLIGTKECEHVLALMILELGI
jgi:hypothetical protein